VAWLPGGLPGWLDTRRDPAGCGRAPEGSRPRPVWQACSRRPQGWWARHAMKPMKRVDLIKAIEAGGCW